MFRAFRAEVADALTVGLETLDLPTGDLGIEEPPGDVAATLASSVAFRLAEELGSPPPAAAEELADAIDPAPYDYIRAVTTQGPYVNFQTSHAYLQETVEAAQAEDYGQLANRDESVVVEHTSANPTGPVHVGRARNPILGDAVANVLDTAGYDVERHYYVNDAGRQMAVFTWAYEKFDESELAGEPARDRAEYDLVRYYRRGNDFLETADDEAVETAEAEISAILQGLEAGDEATYERVGEVVDTVLGGMQDCLARLPAEFDEFVKETRFMRDGSTDEVADRLKTATTRSTRRRRGNSNSTSTTTTRTSSSCGRTGRASIRPATSPTTSGSSRTSTARSPSSVRITNCRPGSYRPPSIFSVTTPTDWTA
jgi:Arginyl-tRNA synthetase